MQRIKQMGLISLLIILLLASVGVVAQDGNLAADDVRQFEPVAIYSGGGGSGAGVGPDGQYELLAVPLSPPMFQLQMFSKADGSLVHDFGATSRFEFIGDSFILWVGNPQSQQPRLYGLPEMEEVGEFPLGANVYPRQQGEGFFYVSGSSVFFQPSDLAEPPATLTTNLGYTEAYIGDLKELPDGRTVLIAGQNKTILYDLETGSISSEIVYPLMQSITLSADGTRLSAVTNYDVFSSMASNWLAYDLAEGKTLVELYGQRGAHGGISTSGKYGAASQLVTDSRMGVLHIYDLDTGEELLRAENIAHGGIPGQTSFLFVDDRLVFVRDWNGQSGFLSVFDPASGDVSDLEIPVLWIVDSLYRWAGAPVLSDTTSMIEVNTPEGYSIFDVDSLEIVRTFPSIANYDSDNRVMTISIGGMSSILFDLPTDERPALLTLAGTTGSQNINVRAQPSTNGDRVAGASGEVIAIGRNADSTWILLLSHGGWVSSDLVTLNGDIETLTMIP